MSQVNCDDQSLIEDIKNQPGIWKTTYNKSQMMSAWNKLSEKYGKYIFAFFMNIHVLGSN